MRCVGGKHRQSTVLAQWVRKLMTPGSSYYEPFCGALGSARKTVPAALTYGARKVVLSDAGQPIMTMWKAAFNGWMPPDKVSRKTFMRLRATRDPNDPMTAFAGFGCGFGGRFFGAFGCKGDEQAARRARDAVLAKVLAIADKRVTLKCCDYRKIEPIGAVMYLDPPYTDLTKLHSHKEDFDADGFWEYARGMSIANRVIITSFQAPKDFVPVHSWGNTVGFQDHIRGTTGRTFNECIYMHKSKAKEFK